MTRKTTPQISVWEAEFGRDYTDRNPHSLKELDDLYQNRLSVTRSCLNEEFLGDFDRSMRILEVGANVGAQLDGLRRMGFGNLHAIEIQPYAIEIGRRNLPDVRWTRASAFDIPYEDGYFDLVYTSSVLIHISPETLGHALDEIHRCARQYIWGYEYFCKSLREVRYRERDDLMWKDDYSRVYQQRFPDLELVKERRLPYQAGRLEDSMFLLRKK